MCKCRHGSAVSGPGPGPAQTLHNAKMSDQAPAEPAEIAVAVPESVVEAANPASQGQESSQPSPQPAGATAAGEDRSQGSAGEQGAGSRAGSGQGRRGSKKAAKGSKTAQNSNAWLEKYNDPEFWTEVSAEGLLGWPGIVQPHGDHAAIEANGGEFQVYCQFCKKTFRCKKTSIEEHLQAHAKRAPAVRQWLQVRRLRLHPAMRPAPVSAACAFD